MDYLLDAYFFKYFPFDVSKQTKLAITSKAVDIVRIADWWCKATDPRKILSNHTSLFVAEMVFYLLCIMTFCHAFRHGGRYLFTWIGIFILGLTVENIHYIVPDADIVWHAQSTLTFFGMRTPLFIILGMYHMIGYTAYVMARRLRVPWWAEGPAAGIVAVMLDFPLHFMGIKLLWWQWHESDPLFRDRFYSVPWIMLAFDAVVMCSFTSMLHLSRRLLLSSTYDWKLFVREFLCVLFASGAALALAELHLSILFHPLHAILKIHASVPTLGLLGFYSVIVFIADRNNGDRDARPRAGEIRYWFDELACAICIHYLFYVVLTLSADPQNIVAEGLHQPIGPCNATETVHTLFGRVLSRQKYLCPYKRYENFDFHCLPNQEAPLQLEEEPLEWYVMCATDFSNRFEYIAIVLFTSILSLAVLYQMAARSGRTPVDPLKVYTKRVQRITAPKTKPSKPFYSTMECQESEDEPLEAECILDDLQEKDIVSLIGEKLEQATMVSAQAASEENSAPEDEHAEPAEIADNRVYAETLSGSPKTLDIGIFQEKEKSPVKMSPNGIGHILERSDSEVKAIPVQKKSTSKTAKSRASRERSESSSRPSPSPSPTTSRVLRSTRRERSEESSGSAEHGSAIPTSTSLRARKKRA